ncbi:MAG: FABP family protein [Candidatus Nanopelagicales bacterium]
MGQLPSELAHLSWLIGRWGGIGEGGYPTTQPFRYEQEVEFASDGRPFLEYRSISWIVDDQNKRIRQGATESGYWRPRPNNGVELLLAHPTGFVEVWIGHVDVTAILDARITGARIELTTDAVVRTESAKDVSAGHRLYGLVEGRLLSTYDMAAMGHPLTNHLAIAMERISAGPAE